MAAHTQKRAGHYILPLWFLLLSSSSFFLAYSQRSQILDVYHTSTHDVALVRIQNACLKCAAHRSLKTQDAKNRHLRTISQLYRVISSQLRHVSTIGKNS